MVNGLGQGPGEYSPRGSSGAGHGGTGGHGGYDVDIGAFYGSVFYPTSFGSTGGGGKSPGGGVIKITTSELQVDGDIECKGGVYEGGINHGGGSGGSIFINATIIRGEGVIDATGGSGNGLGGGGSGGRIAVYYHSSSFSGHFTAFGGSSSYEAGAAGTVYEEDCQKHLKHLWISNRNQKPRSLLVNFANPRKDHARTWLPLLSNNSKYDFDQVTLTGGSHLILESGTHGETMTIGKLSDVTSSDVGNDVTSFLHVGPWQTIRLRETGVLFPVNVRVYKDGTLWLPPSIQIKKTVFDSNGRLSGLKELTVSETTINFGADSGSVISGPYVAQQFAFERVTVNAAGKIIFTNAEHGNVLLTNELKVKAKGLIQARILSIRSDVIEVEETGSIVVDGQGFEQGARNKNFGGQYDVGQVFVNLMRSLPRLSFRVSRLKLVTVPSTP